MACGGQRASWVRELTPSLLRMLVRCVSTVRLEMKSREAISRLLRPSATRRATSISHPSRAGPAAVGAQRGRILECGCGADRDLPPAAPAAQAGLPTCLAGPQAVTETFAQAVEHGDEHVIKFADTAADVYARTGNADALAAAIRATQLIAR
jgi:hypothetical protein